MVNMRCKF